jgi:hypothetical protein
VLLADGLTLKQLPGGFCAIKYNAIFKDMEIGRSDWEEMAVAVNENQPTEEGQTAGASDTLSFAFCWLLIYFSPIIIFNLSETNY